MIGDTMDNIFEIEYDRSLNAFLIYKISNNQKTLYYNINHGWHVIDISFDKKKVLFALNINHDYYLLDGNTGKISFINSFNVICCPSKDFKYLIVPSCNENWPTLEVIYMDTLDVKFIIPWDVPIRNAMSYDGGGECRPIMYNNDSIEDLSKSL